MPWVRHALPFVLAIVLASAGVLNEARWDRSQAEQALVDRVSASLSARVAIARKQLLSFSVTDFDSLQLQDVFLLQGDSLERWSEHEFLPDFGKIGNEQPLQFIASSRSNFLALQKQLDDARRLILVINLQNKYQAANRYLSTELVSEFFPIQSGIVLPVDAMVGLPVEVEGKPLFKIAPLDLDTHAPGSIWLFMAALLFVLFGVVMMVRALEQFSRGWAFVFLTASLVVTRAVQLVFHFPRLWVKGPLFDPQVYASSYLNFSLGDLLINSLLVLVVVTYGYLRWLPAWLNQQNAPRWNFITHAGLFFLLCLAVLFPYLFFESIYHNSQLTLDISDTLQVNARRVVAWMSALAGLLAGWCTVLALVRILFQAPVKATRTYFAFVTAFSLFLLYAFVEGRSYEIPAVVILVTIGLSAAFGRRMRFGVQWQLLLAVLGCSYAAMAVFFLGEERKREYQQRFAVSYLSSRDELGEFLLSEVSAKIANDPFIASVWNNPLRNRSVIKEKIKRVYLQNYFNQYDVGIELFESSGKRADTTEAAGLAAVLTSMSGQMLPTGYEGVFIRQAPTLPAARNYRVVTRVGRGRYMAGFVVVDLTLKRAIPESVFPEVLLDEKRIQGEVFGPYSYAWWEQDRILNRFGSFDYERLAVNSFRDGVRFSAFGFEHFPVQEREGRWLVVSRPAYTFAQGLANFCFFLLLASALVGVAVAIQRWREVVNWHNHTYAQRMQIATLLSATLPFVIIAVTLFQLIRGSNREQLNTQFVQRARNLNQALEGLPLGRDSDLTLDQVRQFTDLDFSIFDAHGRLMVTNQPAVYDQQVLSPLLAPSVLTESRGAAPLVREERIGKLSYKTCYLPIRDSENHTYAILSVPFFDFDQSNERSEIQTLNVLLILFVVVGLFAVLLSIRLSRQLVSPLQWIAHTLSQTTFQNSPSRLEWKRKDELGVLVDAYNRMLNNWTEAKDKLAQQEKESAWREMAKQVAHEIKNPLTPMKLTLQQMQLLQARKDLTDGKVAESVAALLHQVELLNEIASSFSAFAGMPQPKFEQLQVGEVLAQVVRLYPQDAQHRADVVQPADPVYVWADEKILSRAFTNILLNAWQSSDRPVQVVIRVERLPDGVQISFADNGPGITEEQRAKIFSPYFTTKKTGSGLGLAITKQGIERCRGSIRFESTVGVGTTFFVHLPLMHPAANPASSSS